jgi:hypothetical protein
VLSKSPHLRANTRESAWNWGESERLRIPLIAAWWLESVLLPTLEQWFLHDEIRSLQVLFDSNPANQLWKTLTCQWDLSPFASPQILIAGFECEFNVQHTKLRPPGDTQSAQSRDRWFWAL